MHRARTRPATPLPPTRAGLRFQHVQYRNRVVNSEDRNDPEDTVVVRASADFVSFTFLCKYSKLVQRKIDI